MTPATILREVMSFLEKQRRYRGLRGVGQEWEGLAEKRLRSEGYEIRDRNFRGKAGEIDFVAEENGVLCFVEVKGRAGLKFGAPAEAVTDEKQRRICRAAEEYLKRKRIGRVACRFDVVSILDSDGRADVTILRGAFEDRAPRARRR